MSGGPDSLIVMWDWWNVNSGAMQALDAVALLMVASVAALVAWAQVGEARRLRREQAQPYVAAGMRSSAAAENLIEVYFRNYGMTAAFDVTVECDPPLTAKWGAGEIEPVLLFETLPTMVPGEEWATLWDSALGRWESGQAMSSTVTITFRDSAGGRHTGKYVLDWNAHKDRHYVAQKNLDDLAEAVIKISQNFNQVVEGRALIVQDKEARQAELTRWRTERQATRAPEGSADS